MQFVFSIRAGKRYRFPTHTNDLIIDRADAQTSEVFVVALEPGEAPPPHVHTDVEQIFYILEGTGALVVGDAPSSHPLQAGDVVRIPPKTLHSVRAEGGPMRYLAVDCFTAERVPEEPTWDAHVQALCRAQGWEFDRVVGADNR